MRVPQIQACSMKLQAIRVRLKILSSGKILTTRRRYLPCSSRNEVSLLLILWLSSHQVVIDLEIPLTYIDIECYTGFGTLSSWPKAPKFLTQAKGLPIGRKLEHPLWRHGTLPTPPSNSANTVSLATQALLHLLIYLVNLSVDKSNHSVQSYRSPFPC